MGFRKISLEQSAFDRLVEAMRPGESYSDVVNRLTGADEPSLLDLVGLLSAKRADQLKEALVGHRVEQRRLQESRRCRDSW